MGGHHIKNKESNDHITSPYVSKTNNKIRKKEKYHISSLVCLCVCVKRTNSFVF